MKKVKLGKTALKFLPIVFGGNVFGWTTNESQSFVLLDEFVANGFSMLDTANNYSHWAQGNKGGESETIIGNWLKKSGKRDQVIIATKIGGTMPVENPKPNASGNYIIKGAEDSLRRLQTDVIDLFQLHYDDGTTPVEETLEAFTTLVKQGKIRYAGASNISKERLAQSLETSAKNGLETYHSLQPEYNLYTRGEYETAYAPLAEKWGFGVIPYYSLASGFLTGKYRSPADTAGKERGRKAREMLNPKGFSILHALDTVAAAYSTTPASVALAWLMAQPTITAPIVSATKTGHIKSFTDAVELQLTTDDLKILSNAGTIQ